MQGTNGSERTLDCWRRFASAIILRAVKDATPGKETAEEARAWLVSDPLAHFLIDSTDLDAAAVRAWAAQCQATN